MLPNNGATTALAIEFKVKLLAIRVEVRKQDRAEMHSKTVWKNWVALITLAPI